MCTDSRITGGSEPPSRFRLGMRSHECRSERTKRNTCPRGRRPQPPDAAAAGVAGVAGAGAGDFWLRAQLLHAEFRKPAIFAKARLAQTQRPHRHQAGHAGCAAVLSDLPLPIAEEVGVAWAAGKFAALAGFSRGAGDDGADYHRVSRVIQVWEYRGHGVLEHAMRDDFGLRRAVLICAGSAEPERGGTFDERDARHGREPSPGTCHAKAGVRFADGSALRPADSGGRGAHADAGGAALHDPDRPAAAVPDFAVAPAGGGIRSVAGFAIRDAAHFGPEAGAGHQYRAATVGALEANSVSTADAAGFQPVACGPPAVQLRLRDSGDIAHQPGALHGLPDLRVGDHG